MDTTAREVGARIQNGLLNGIREAASSNFSADGVPDFFLLDVLRTLPDVQLDLITFIIFNHIELTFDILHGSADSLPRWTGLAVVLSRFRSRRSRGN